MATLKSIKNKYLQASDGDDLGVSTNTENISALSFKLATADSLTKFNLVDGFADDYNDATGVDAAASTNETRSASNYYSGAQNTNATGGNIASYTSGPTTYTVHSFLTGGNFVPPSTGNIDVMLVGGGGGGGTSQGGGGGGGGMITMTGYAVTATTYAISIGAGGPGGSPSGAPNPGGTGGSTTGFGETATGGGGGGGNSQAGVAGASGGGGAEPANAGGVGTAPSVSSPTATGYGGYNGGGGAVSQGGGGGGTGQAGQGAGPPPGEGGDGKQWNIDGNNYYWGGGGSGASWGYTPGPAGLGGGGGGGGQSGSATGGAGGGSALNAGNPGFGYGQPSTTATTGGNGGANTGGGGGGGTATPGVTPTTQANGGSGIVQVRYPNNTFSSVGNMTLQSNAFTAQVAPSSARIIMDEQAYVGTTTLNTDVKAYASRDNGTTFSQITLVKQADILNTGGNPASTKLLLTMNGANNGTTFTDTSASNHTVTAVANAKTSSAQSKFGGSSGLFDGTGDGLTIPDSADWDWGTDPFTIDMWVRGDSTQTAGGYKGLISTNGTSWASGEWTLSINTTTGFVEWWINDVGGGALITSTTNMKDDAWHHVALTKSGDDTKLFIDGTQEGSTYTTGYSLVTPATGLIIGNASYSADRAFTGYMNEMRLVKGVATWTENFAVPIAPYGAGDFVPPKRLLSGSVDISGQPAGTNMKYKIETLNQAAAKQTRVYGTSMAWA